MTGTLYRADGTKEELKFPKFKSLELLQNLVGGYIEAVPLVIGANEEVLQHLIIKEEGLIHSLPANVWSLVLNQGTKYHGIIFRGDVILLDGLLP